MLAQRLHRRRQRTGRDRLDRTEQPEQQRLLPFGCRRVRRDTRIRHRHEVFCRAAFFPARGEPIARQVGEETVGEARQIRAEVGRIMTGPHGFPEREFHRRRRGGRRGGRWRGAKIEVALQRGVLPRHLAIMGRFPHLAPDLRHQLADLQARGLYMPQQGGTERAVAAAPVIGDVAWRGGERDQRAGSRLYLAEPGAGGSPCAGLQASPERIVPARIEDQDRQPRRPVELLQNPLQIERLEPQVTIGFDVRRRRHQPVASRRLQRVAGEKEHGGIRAARPLAQTPRPCLQGRTIRVDQRFRLETKPAQSGGDIGRVARRISAAWARYDSHRHRPPARPAVPAPGLDRRGRPKAATERDTRRAASGAPRTGALALDGVLVGDCVPAQGGVPAQDGVVARHGVPAAGGAGCSVTGRQMRGTRRSRLIAWAMIAARGMSRQVPIPW